MKLSYQFDTENIWLITGVAGFIGSNLLEYLLKNNQKVVGIDNFSTGTRENLDILLSSCSDAQKQNFQFCEGDIRDFAKCNEVMQGIDIVLHQAALGSVPRSLEEPDLTHENNVNGSFNILRASKEHKVKALIYASSSSVYGDSEASPKTEDTSGNLLSPYAATKYINEIYADVFARSYGMSIIGIRYFNVFGPRQSKDGAYAAVIPTWISGLLEDKEIYINGDGLTSRDFTYVSNIVSMNMLAAKRALLTKGHKVYNVGAEQRTTLLELFDLISKALGKDRHKLKFREFRKGDIRHSFADITLAKNELGYLPICLIEDGIKLTTEWFKENFIKL